MILFSTMGFKSHTCWQPSHLHLQPFQLQSCITNAPFISTLRGSTGIWNTAGLVLNLPDPSPSSLYLFIQSLPICSGVLKKWLQILYYSSPLIWLCLVTASTKKGHTVKVKLCDYCNHSNLWLLRWGHRRLHNFCLVVNCSVKHPLVASHPIVNKNQDLKMVHMIFHGFIHCSLALSLFYSHLPNSASATLSSLPSLECARHAPNLSPLHQFTALTILHCLLVS